MPSTETINLPDRAPCDVISTSDVADILGVSTRAVRLWCENGKLKSTKLRVEHAILWRDFLVFWNEYSRKK